MTAGISDFPATLPAKTVVGRLASTAGPAEAVPIAALSSQLADASTITFTPSGAGAVARTVQNKLREVITSADFNDTHGTQNTGLGVSALSSVITGDQNTAIGYQALKAVTGTISVDGRNNVAVGSHALEVDTIGSQNIGIGNQVLQSLTIGGNNVAVGNASNHDNVSGNDNVSIGVDSLRFNTGSGNTAIGTSALQSQVAGASNTAIGQGAGANNISGVQGIFIGFSAGRYETVSNTFYLDNTNRGSAAADKAGALFYGSSIGTGAVSLQRLQINAVVTAPVQPAFLAIATATANATGDATLATIIFGTEVFDQHSDFASNTFTAPVTGKYHFDANIQGTGLAAGNTAYLINFNTTKRSITACRINPGPIIVAGELNLCAGITCDMDAGDTCSVRFEVDGGTKIVGYGVGSFFSGHLVC